MGRPETSITTYQSSLRNIPEQQRSQHRLSLSEFFTISVVISEVLTDVPRIMYAV